MFKKTLTTNREQVWEPTENFEEKMPTICATLMGWMDGGIHGPISEKLVESEQGVYVEKLFF